jgi:hypothetical protein
MIPIICYFHSLFVLGDPPRKLGSALPIILGQMNQYHRSGLTDSASEFHVGVNGGKESEQYSRICFPKKAKIAYHGLQSRAENLTVVMLWKHAQQIEGEAYFCYVHSKGATHEPNSSYGEGVSKPWRQAMMEDLVTNWRKCVAALNEGHDIACSHWMWNMADGTQHIPAGGFLWVKASFVRKLPSMHLRDRIKVSGISAAESRYESEVFWGNGPRPNVFQFRPNGGGGVP